MQIRFVITEFFRMPDENYGIVKIWYYKNTNTAKRRLEIHGSFVLDMFFDTDGRLHRDFFQPAYISSNGKEEYWFHGVKHRNHFEPAVIYPNGAKEYWVHGEKRFETFETRRMSR